MTVLQAALPAQSSTRTGTRLTPLATPQVVPPTVPATWVPWPLQSLVPLPSPTKSAPGSRRPVNSEWSGRMPVSTMNAVTPAAVLEKL
ncbi:hypothetical protein D3C86_1873440 [compost metagenome]